VRPTIGETLRGIRRILAEVVAPEVRAPYPAETLHAILTDLEVIERSWDRVLAFLHWDNAAMAALLGAIEPLVDPQLAAHVRAMSAAGPVDGLAFDAVNARNEEMRALLAAAIPQLAVGGERTAAAYARVRAYLREHMDRYPMILRSVSPPAAQ
jgi:hypothetical protein